MSAVLNTKLASKEDYSSDNDEVSLELDEEIEDHSQELKAPRPSSRFRSRSSPKSKERSFLKNLPCSRGVANLTVMIMSAGFIALAVALIVILNRGNGTTTCEDSVCITGPLANLVKELTQRSMLHEARALIYKQRNDGREWRTPYGENQARDLIERDKGDVWLDLYPASVVPKPGESVMNTMGDEELWKHLKDLGISVVHLNPVRRSGGITTDLQWTPTTDGGYDRVSLQVEPLYGTDDDYRSLVRTAAQYSGYIAGDIVPGHTGTGADWQLAMMNYKDYPYLFHMIEILPKDWSILPTVPEGHDAVNVSPDLERTLANMNYIDGIIDVVIFKTTGVKETNWAVTREVSGVDGVMRRWVYLHLFKQGQPTLNWLHPSFTAHELVVGDLIKTISDLGAKIVRFDANSLLGTERITDNSTHAKSLFHPLSAVTTQMLAMTVRKLGGYSYEENSILSKTLLRLGQATTFGPDLSYDFTIRGGFISALLTGDTRLLKLQLDLMLHYDVGRGQRAIHSLQNHDELVATFNYDEANPDELFTFGNVTMKAVDINAQVIKQNYAAAQADGVRLGEYGGLSTTLTTLVAGRLDIDLNGAPASLSSHDRQRIINGTLMLAAFNALQPGLFQVSAWDLLGALQLNSSDVDPQLLADGDLRWLNRGAYDLMGYHPDSNGRGVTGLPMSKNIFGSIPKQLTEPLSYVSQLQRMLAVRSELKIAVGDLQPDLSASVSNVNSSDIVVLATLLPRDFNNAVQIALLFVNWSTNTISPSLPVSSIGQYDINLGLPAMEHWPNLGTEYTIQNATLQLSLPPLGASLVVVSAQ